MSKLSLRTARLLHRHPILLNPLYFLLSGQLKAMMDQLSPYYTGRVFSTAVLLMQLLLPPLLSDYSHHILRHSFSLCHNHIHNCLYAYQQGILSNLFRHLKNKSSAQAGQTPFQMLVYQIRTSVSWVSFYM